MQQKIVGFHREDPDKNPAGGRTTGIGIVIDWQDGPLGRHNAGCSPEFVDKDGNKAGGGCVEGCTRREQNGAFVEGVIQAAIDRLEYYQSTKFDCIENALAIHNLRGALCALDIRTKNREAREVEGTHSS